MKKIRMICLMLLLMLCASSRAENVEAEKLFVAENDRLSLSLSADLAGIEVLDKVSGSVWSSSMNDETFDMDKMNAMWKKKMGSLLMLNYTSLNKGFGSINNMALLADKQYSASYELIDRGVRIRYVFGSCGVQVDVEITLEGNSLLLSIPYSGIVESDQFSVVSLDIMPFFCAASDTAEGFFLYPDGCGAVMEFTDSAHLNEKTKLYSIYGSMENHDSLLGFLDAREPRVMLPVFAMNRGGNAVVCVLEEGAETGRISVNSSNNIVRANYMFANVLYRRGFDDKRVTDRNFKIYDKKAIETDYALRVMFLPENQADYSAMARAYREYLINSEGLKPKQTKPGMVLDIFMTTNEKGLLMDTPRTVTTMAEAQAILTAFHEVGVSNMQVSLKGWSRNGYGNVPDRMPVSGSVGGNQALNSLIETAKRLQYPLSLTVNFLEAKSDQGGYSKRNDAIYTGNYAIITDKKESVFLLSPDVALQKVNDFLRQAQPFRLSGVHYEWMGNLLPFNYYARRYITANETLELYRQILEKTKNTFGQVSVQGGGAYTLPFADLVTGIPMEDYGYQFTTKSVPFYQMVMHGLVDYTGVPGNKSSDLDREVLRWVEMGYLPYFELTYGDTEDLMHTQYQSLFSAKYSAWLDRVAGIASDFEAGALKELHNAQMIQHDVLSRHLVRVTYDNGLIVHVNYSQEDAAIDGLVIPARDYLVTKEGQP